jgi:hypothetical protein
VEKVKYICLLYLYFLHMLRKILCHVFLMNVEEVVKLWHNLSKGNANYHEELCNFYGDFRHKMGPGVI